MFGCDGDSCSNSFSEIYSAKETQFYINAAFLNVTNSFKIPLPTVNLIEIPPTLYQNGDASTSLEIWHSVLAVILFIPSIFSIKDVTTEKENQIHVYMIVMGMKRYVYYLSHFIFSTIKMWIFLLPAGAAFVVYIKVDYKLATIKQISLF